MTEEFIEQQIPSKGRSNTSISDKHVEAEIAAEHYFNAGDAVYPGDQAGSDYQDLRRITVCVLILRNGHKVVGVNCGPVDPANFDVVVGHRYAREAAVEQIWPLLGFRLRDSLANGEA